VLGEWWRVADKSLDGLDKPTIGPQKCPMARGKWFFVPTKWLGLIKM
jgi:hypothetical protein